MSTIKTLALAAVLVFGVSQLAFAQYGGSSGGSTSGGSSYGSSNKAQQKNTDPRSGKSGGTGSGMDQR